jgi:ribosomal protein L11 methyltransferase
MRALVVSVDPAEAELAADALWALGVVAVEERATANGTVELWTSLGDDQSVIEEAVAGFSASWRWSIVEVDEGVADTWRNHAVPVRVAEDLVVCPAWIDPPAVGEATVLFIEPGSTFGMGDHPTTIESLRALRRHIRPGARVLDVGCGSGILAIAAVRLGASAAHGIDISPAAVPTTRDNARRNGVDGAVTASTEPLADIRGTYDIVLANILAPALIDLADDLRRVLADDGVLVVSGVLADRNDHVCAALSPLRVVERDESNGWVALSLRR